MCLNVLIIYLRCKLKEAPLGVGGGGGHGEHASTHEANTDPYNTHADIHTDGVGLLTSA